MILAGDIGGTKTALAWVDAGAVVATRTVPSAGFASLAEIVRAFLAMDTACVARAACFGIAGPIVGDIVRTTNLPWVIDRRELSALLGTPRVRLINDLEAVAHGVGVLGDDELVTLNPGRSDRSGNAAVIAAGTGLGEAGLYWDGAVHHPFATEGGHASFAPRNELEIGLLRFLLAEHQDVSWERVLSGPGLHGIYRYLRDGLRAGEPEWLTDRLRDGDPAAIVAGAALDGSSPVCRRALDLFVTLYGAEAGNLALKTLATGGVFVAGGIAPKILPALTGGNFLRAFVRHGRFRPVLEAIPVQVVVSDAVALRGAARAAVLDDGA
ncbi:MAG: glucokinase [Vicinamibacterales bacterium]